MIIMKFICMYFLTGRVVCGYAEEKDQKLSTKDFKYDLHKKMSTDPENLVDNFLDLF